MFFQWQQLLEERTRQTLRTMSEVPGVVGLVLAGSVGRGEPWPLSDIDILPIYEDEQRIVAVPAVESIRAALTDGWAPEGYATCVDVGRLHFSRSEVVAVLGTAPADAVNLLGDPRWFHSLDKGYGSRAGYDPEGLAAGLANYLTIARFEPAVRQGRIDYHCLQTTERRKQAHIALGNGDVSAAALALRESLHALMRYLMEKWGGRDNSFGRFGTRFEQLAAIQGESELARDFFRLNDLSSEDITERLAAAPVGIRLRHHLSFDARRSVGEEVTAEQDARDVLLSFSTHSVRHSPPPYPMWLAIESDSHRFAKRLALYDALLDRIQIQTELSV